MTALMRFLLLALFAASPLAAQDVPSRSPSQQKVLKGIIMLPYEKHLATLGSLKLKPVDAFYNCLCAGAGYGSSSTQQFYHPDTIGDYSLRWACNHPGDPCVVSGFGCMRYPLPDKPALWERCSLKHPEGPGGSVTDALLNTLALRSGLEKRKIGDDLKQCLARYKERDATSALRNQMDGYAYLSAKGVPVLPPPKRLAEKQKAAADMAAVDAGHRLREAEAEISKALDQTLGEKLMQAAMADKESQVEVLRIAQELGKLAQQDARNAKIKADSLFKAARAQARSSNSPEAHALARKAQDAATQADAKLRHHQDMASRLGKYATALGVAHDAKQFYEALSTARNGTAEDKIAAVATTLGLGADYLEMLTEPYGDELADLTAQMEKIDPLYRSPKGLKAVDHARMTTLQDRVNASTKAVEGVRKGLEVGAQVAKVYGDYKHYTNLVKAAESRMNAGRHSEAQENLLMAMNVLSRLAESSADFLPAGVQDVPRYFAEALKMPEMADSFMRQAVDTQENYAQIKGSQAGQEAMKKWVQHDGHDLMRDDYLFRQAGLAAYVEDKAVRDPFVFLPAGTLIGTDRMGYDRVAELAYLYPIAEGRRMTDADLRDLLIKHSALNQIDLGPMREKAKVKLEEAAVEAHVAAVYGKKTISKEELAAYSGFDTALIGALPFGCQIDPDMERSLFAKWRESKDEQAKVATWLKAYGQDMKDMLKK